MSASEIKIQIEPGNSLESFSLKFFILALLGSSSCYFFQMTHHFTYAKEFSYFCVPPGLDGKKFSNDEIKLLTTPDESDTCSVYKLDYAKFYENFTNYDQVIENVSKFSELNNSFDLTSCSDVGGYFKFDVNEGEDIAADFQLVCEKLESFSLIEAISLGYLLGSVVIGVLGDKLGRKKTLTISSIPFAVLNFLFAYTPSSNILYWIHVLLGFFCQGIVNILMVIVAENSIGKRREIFTILLNLCFSLAFGVSNIFSYGFTQWRIFLTSMSVLVVIIFSAMGYKIESPKDLLIKPSCNKSLKNQEIVKIFTSQFFPSIFTFSLIFPILWIVFDYSSTLITSNPLNLSQEAFFTLVDVCGFFLTALLASLIKRKRFEILLMFAFGVSMILAFSYPKGGELAQMFWNITRGLVNPLISLMSLHVLEIFPAEIRSTAFGVVSASGPAANYFYEDFIDGFNKVVDVSEVSLIRSLIISFTVVSCFLIMKLPETKGMNLEDFCIKDEKKNETKIENNSKVYEIENSTVYALILFTVMALTFSFKYFV